MISTATLTSLAILRKNVDKGSDYLDYLRPFILQVLAEHELDIITTQKVNKHILEQFGLKIPDRTVEIVLKRIAKIHNLTKKDGVYQLTNKLPDPQIITKMNQAKRHIDAIVHGLQKFSQDSGKVISDPNEAVVAICTFLAEFDITCLRAYLRGTAIPDIQESHETDIVLVSDYIQHLSQINPERFESFLVLVQGHMMANALMCPDLENISGTFNEVTFYLDTPLLVQILGLEGESKQDASKELISLINKLGGELAIFDHSYDELKKVLHGAAEHLNLSSGRGSIILEAKRTGITRSDLLGLIPLLEEELNKVNIKVKYAPPYIKKFQIDENAFEQILEDEINYFNPRAREYDINSVRSIYTIRENIFAPSLEKTQAVFVTNNSAFAHAAWKYGQQHRSAQNVSAVISDFSLANVAWLKAPMEAPSIPKMQLLALSYAALKPSDALLNKYLSEVDKLEKQGVITPLAHQLLRSSKSAYSELMHLTLGDDASFTEGTVTQTLNRVSNEIRQEEMNKLNNERKNHQKTQNILESKEIYIRDIENKIQLKCEKKGKMCAYIISIIITLLFVIGVFAGLDPFNELLNINLSLSWLIKGGLSVLISLTLINIITGFHVKKMHQNIQRRFSLWFLMRESISSGVNFNNDDTDD